MRPASEAPSHTFCRICGGGVAPSLTAEERMFGLGGSFPYTECEMCGCLQIKTLPADLEAYYPEAYYAGSGRVSDKPVSSVRPGGAWMRRWSAFRLGPGRLRRLVSGRRFRRFDWFRKTSTGLDDPILDVGCGSGRLLRRMAKAGFSNLTGIDERWLGPTEVGPGLRFERGTPREHSGRYRLVMAHHSFEHMREPAEDFAAMARLVEPGGHLLLRVPRADSWARRHYGADWVQLDAPRHLHLPTRPSLEFLARANGFRILDVDDDSGAFQIWGSELYRRGETLVSGTERGRRGVAFFSRWAARWRGRRIARQGLGDQGCFLFGRLNDVPAPTADS